MAGNRRPEGRQLRTLTCAMPGQALSPGRIQGAGCRGPDKGGRQGTTVRRPPAGRMREMRRMPAGCRKPRETCRAQMRGRRQRRSGSPMTGPFTGGGEGRRRQRGRMRPGRGTGAGRQKTSGRGPGIRKPYRQKPWRMMPDGRKQDRGDLPERPPGRKDMGRQPVKAPAPTVPEMPGMRKLPIGEGLPRKGSAGRGTKMAAGTVGRPGRKQKLGPGERKGNRRIQGGRPGWNLHLTSARRG